VGRYAIQLAARGGADVIAITSDRTQVDGLRTLGATEVLAYPSELTRKVFGVLDNVGGPQLVAGFDAPQAGGQLISIGHAAHVDETFEYGAFRPVASTRRSPSTTNWKSYADATAALLDRRLHGKAVLEVA
jgi:NADPH:quinone reductase-like Zn-dependent oxidoreductase